MEIDCGMKNRDEKISGRHTAQTAEFSAIGVAFTAQLEKPKNPQGQCMVMDLLNSGGSRKNTLDGYEYSRCEGCGRDIIVVIESQNDR